MDILGERVQIGTCKRCGAPVYAHLTFGSGAVYEPDLCDKCYTAQVEECLREGKELKRGEVLYIN